MPSTTCWFVRMCPWVSRKNPDPLLFPSAVGPVMATVARKTRSARADSSALSTRSRETPVGRLGIHGPFEVIRQRRLAPKTVRQFGIVLVGLLREEVAHRAELAGIQRVGWHLPRGEDAALVSKHPETQLRGID